jgi:hypothetical protein
MGGHGTVEAAGASAFSRQVSAVWVRRPHPLPIELAERGGPAPRDRGCAQGVSGCPSSFLQAVPFGDDLPSTAFRAGTRKSKILLLITYCGYLFYDARKISNSWPHNFLLDPPRRGGILAASDALAASDPDSPGAGRPTRRYESSTSGVVPWLAGLPPRCFPTSFLLRSPASISRFHVLARGSVRLQPRVTTSACRVSAVQVRIASGRAILTAYPADHDDKEVNP